MLVRACVLAQHYDVVHFVCDFFEFRFGLLWIRVIRNYDFLYIVVVIVFGYTLTQQHALVLVIQA